MVNERKIEKLVIKPIFEEPLQRPKDTFYYLDMVMAIAATMLCLFMVVLLFVFAFLVINYGGCL